ncbi:MAG: hypothetical protein RLY86_2060 [Pseudomonadota bacterium]|jgi:TonB-dependent receptor
MKKTAGPLRGLLALGASTIVLGMALNGAAAQTNVAPASEPSPIVPSPAPRGPAQSPAESQVAQAAPAAEGETLLEEIIITGFRGSLLSALNAKRNATGVVDVINAEDIADFPDLNLAESLQRVPGVAIDRDGGEGRSITVRGLSADFTRVRLNGLEALATTGGKDGSGGANRGRGFDFNVFASELFSSLTVRKSQSAEVEEGSLGATVDLQTARPFNYDDFVFATSGQIGYNDLSKEKDPRGTLLISDTFLDDKIGVLASVAYTKRNTLEEGSSTGRWENPAIAGNSAGPFAGAATLPANNAWHPRIPRYGRLTYDQDRLGATGAIQIRPWEGTQIDLDVLYANLDGTRQEEYLEVISFSRNAAAGGNAQTSVINPRIDDRGNLVAGTFNGVDVRTEQRIDELETEFTQYSIGLEQELTETLTFRGVAGWSKSVQDNPVQTTLSLERYNVQNYRYDFSDPNLPFFDYGFDVTNPANYVFSPSNRLVNNGPVVGDASLIRMRPNKTENTFATYRGDLEWETNEWLTLKSGVTYKDYTFDTEEFRRFATVNPFGGPTQTEAAVALPAGVTVADISELVTGFGRNLGMPEGTPSSFVVPSIARVADILGIYCNCVNQFGDFRLSIDNQRGANRSVDEKSLGGYLQADFETELAGMPFRGDLGVRIVRTELASTGFTGTALFTVEREYTNTLPAMNLVLEPTDDVFVRFGAAKVLSRPQLPALAPGGAINNNAQTLNIGNPFLEPIKSNTVDLSFEWYPDRESLVSLGLFYKDIKTYIQRITETIPYSQTGQPASLLSGNNTPDTVFTVQRDANTEGGPLKGFEISVQRPFDFLPEPFDGFGGIVNLTYVDSQIEYVVGTNQTVDEQLVNLSPLSFNATLYYEKDGFSARISGAFRDEYLTGVPGGNGNALRGKASTFNLDFSASYEVTEQITVSFEAINLTDQFDERWVGDPDRKNLESYEHTGRQFYLGASYRY